MFSLFTVLVLACTSYAYASDYTYSFNEFRIKYNKTYPIQNDYNYRFNVFSKNLDIINKHNNQNNATWSMGINEWTDLTWSEFSRSHLGYKPKSTFPSCLPDNRVVITPKSIDWVEKGAVTPVKNQKSCGSCWSFSTTGAIESAHAIHTGNLISLSEQQLVDCSESYGNHGCSGGLMDYAFKYVEDNGLCSEDSYPYEGKDKKCKSTCTKQVTISNYHDVDSNNEDALEVAVAKQPVSVAIEADRSVFQFYSHGIMDGNCGTNLDHGVLVVGYGSEYGKNFWKVKNSWGPDWGEEGYIRLFKQGGKTYGKCGIAMEPSYPIV